MPANKKHLETSIIQRTLKITAGLIGGFLLSMCFHLFWMYFFSPETVFTTLCVTHYLLWAILFVIAFLFDQGLKVWVIYLGLSLLFYLPYLVELLHS